MSIMDEVKAAHARREMAAGIINATDEKDPSFPEANATRWRIEDQYNILIQELTDGERKEIETWPKEYRVIRVRDHRNIQ